MRWIFLLIISFKLASGLEILKGNAQICSNRFCYGIDSWHVSYVVHPESDDKTAPAAVEFQIEKTLTKFDSPLYVAIGFSHDGQMGNGPTPVTACIFDPTKPNTPTVTLSVNKGYDNDRIKNTTWEHILIINPQMAVISGVLLCSFSQLLDSSNTYEVPYSLMNSQYHLILASGDVSGKALTHHVEKPVSMPLVDFKTGKLGANTTEGCVKPVERLLTKIHAIIMIFGWWLIVPTAIFFSRYFRQIWPEKQPFGLRLWFHFHRGLNLVAVLMVVAAFVVILVKDCGTWVAGKSDHHYYHTVPGLTGIIAIMIQPVMSLVRCGPTDKWRPIFNWVHRIVGLGGFCCSCAAIWWAKEFQMGLNERFYGPASVGIMIFYFVALGLSAIALEIHMFVTEVVQNPNSSVREMQMRGFGKNKGMTVSHTKMESNYSPAWAYTRSGILGFFVLCAVGVTVALTTMIGVIP